MLSKDQSLVSSHTKCKGIDCSLVIGPLISQSRFELCVDRLEVDARNGYFAILVEGGGRCNRIFGGESRRNGD